MNGVGKIGVFSWLLAILILFFIGIHFISKDLNSEEEHSLGKERVIDARGGQ